ncbi:Bax inhibitor-1/YccA family protein [Geomesophilobacter sediminis]|uniref:Bax inhibitor-1/YccA family protein n=1 Tax=Geomesophilobacter sediminis TaxID=2798584 RepID=A0A8J7INY3_9BACT|nr:Bax inhibitor-1/YccA family protein [Geomesophilobacter sediminis]MBJ6723904.1 Bax inhibitor-1/YccA family protein [Geomesophilobacter sediminis]
MERSELRYRTMSVPREGVMKGVYAWMSGGLALSALVALQVVSSPALFQALLANRMLFYALVFGELGLVVALSGAINRIGTGTARALFLLYAALNGVTLSTIFVVYTADSIASTFLVTSAMFGAMSLYGYLTKRELDGLGSFCFMGLIGVVIASVVNIFLHSPMVSWVMSLAGILVFTGLTAYDTQKIKRMGYGAGEGKGAILGALTLYLDFINMFLMLLRFLGNRR